MSDGLMSYSSFRSRSLRLNLHCLAILFVLDIMVWDTDWDPGWAIQKGTVKHAGYKFVC